MQEEVTQRTVALCVEATKLSAGMLICSVVLLILTVVAAAYFVAGVYEILIFYRGSHVKMKNLWKMVIGRRGER